MTLRKKEKDEKQKLQKKRDIKDETVNYVIAKLLP